MATRGFEFAYMLDGSNHGPKIMDWPIGTITAKAGDLLIIDSNGYGTTFATAGTVLGILQETISTSNTSATKRRIALACREQVWKCSMDGTTALVPGYSKDLDAVDGNTLDADGTGGLMILVDASGLDDAGTNALAYVCFAETVLD